jgi:DNA-binding MarR family transcriptional regulator
MDNGLLDHPLVSSELVTYAARLVRVVGRQASGDSPASLRLLSQLDELGPSTVTDLAKADRTTQPTVSAALRALEESGHVSREAHPDDARSTLVSLTDEGRAALGRARGRYGEVLDALIEERRVDPAEVARAIHVLRTLTEHHLTEHPTDQPTTS